MTYLKLCFYLLLGISLSAHAQDHHIEELLTVENGLPSNETYASFFDPRGDLYILSDKGLVQYDGQNIKVLTERDGLPSTAVFKHYRDYKGRDWLTTANGICYVENGHIIVPVFNEALKKQRYLAPINNIHVTEQDSVFITSEKFVGGYYKAKMGSPNCVLHKVGVRKSAPFANRLPSTHHLAYLKFKDNKVISCGRCHISVSDTSVSDGKTKQLDFIFEGRKYAFVEKYQILLDSTGGPDFFFISDKLYQFNQTREPQLIQKFEKHILYIKRLKNYLFICLRKGGIIRMHLKSGKSVSFLPNRSIAHLNFENPFEFYASSLESGLLKVNISYDPLFTLPKSLDLNVCVKPFYFDGQTLSIIEGPQIYQYKYTSKKLHLLYQKSFTTANRETYYYKTSWVNKDSAVFGGHNLNLKTAKSIQTPAIESQTFFSNFCAYMFGYGDDGLTIFTLKERLYDPVHFNLDIPISSLAEKNYDTILLGTAQGVYQVTGFMHNAPKTALILPDVSVNDLLYTHNYLIIATEGKGIYFYQKKNIQHLDISSGLDASSAFQLLEQNDTTWVATNMGITYLYKPLNAHSWSFGATGVRGNIAHLYKDGKAIYFRKNRTFFKLKGVHRAFNTVPEPKILFEENPLLNNSSDTCIKLENNRKAFTLEYRLNELKNNKRQLYQYRILGLNDEWIETRAREINYNNLEFGTYTLQIKGMGSSGKWSAIRELEIQVIPLFYQRAWFAPVMYVVAGLLLGLLIFARQIQKSKGLKQRNLVLESSLTNLKLQINPHFIFNALNSLQYLILSDKKKESAKFLTQFSQLVRDILTSSERPFVDLEEETDRLKTYVKLEETRLEKEMIQLRFKNETGFPLNQIQIPSLLLQPLIENSIWHGFTNTPRPPELTVLFSLTDDKKLKIEIADNGIGVDLDQMEINKNNGSLAVKNIEERLYLLSKIEKSEFTINFIPLLEDNNVIGTLVTLTLPLKIASS